MKQNKTNNYHRPNFYGMLRDIVIGSMNKGLFLPTALLLIILTLLLKLDSDQSYNILLKILEAFKRFQIVGWVLSFLFLYLWFNNTKRLRSIHNSEMYRVSAEKKDLQEKLLGKKLQTSN